MRPHAHPDPEAQETQCALGVTVSMDQLEFHNAEWSGVSLTIDVWTSRTSGPVDVWESALFSIYGERSARTGVLGKQDYKVTVLRTDRVSDGGGEQAKLLVDFSPGVGRSMPVRASALLLQTRYSVWPTRADRL